MFNIPVVVAIYLSLVPVAQLVVESLILLLYEHLLETHPAVSDMLGSVLNTALLLKLLGDGFVAVALLLEVNEEGIIRVEVKGELLGECSSTVRLSGLLLAFALAT